MDKYELTVVLPEKTTPAKKKSVLSDLEKLIKIGKGEMGSVEDWGEKTLAYSIEGNQKGIFLHIPLKLDPSFVKQMDTKLKMDDNIIRYLLVKAEK